MSQRFALWTAAGLAIAFALIVSAVLVGPSITAGEDDEWATTQQADAASPDWLVASAGDDGDEDDGWYEDGEHEDEDHEDEDHEDGEHDDD